MHAPRQGAHCVVYGSDKIKKVNTNKVFFLFFCFFFVCLSFFFVSPPPHRVAAHELDTAVQYQHSLSFRF